MRPSLARARTRAFRLLSASLLAALLGLFGCTEGENVAAKTQVTLRIQLQEAPLFEEMTHVRISVFRQEGEKWVKADGAILRKDAIKWPIDIPIVPSSQASASKPFEAIVEALSGDTRLSETRVISSYALNSLRVLEVWLYACADTTQGACSEDSCHGPACSTCSVIGECAPVSVVNPSELPFFDKDESPAVKPYPYPVSDMDAGGGGEAGPIVTESPDAATPSQPAVTCNPACSAWAECVVTGNSAKCTCAAGFEDKSGSCVDIDECAKDGGGCSANATCQNTLGGRNCSCKPGFSDVRGNGVECVDKCAAAGCDAHATCAVVGTEAVCTCPSPYVGDGATCTFDQSCSLLNCDAHAACVVNGTARECKCGTGYTGSGTVCTNVDECMQTTNPCGANSTCTDSDGAYVCGCVTGYRRNGNVCENINDCSPNPCQHGGACSDLVANYSCSCPTGYTGKSCETNPNNCPATNPCLNGGTCVDGLDSYTCSCPTGYSGPTCEQETCGNITITTTQGLQNARNCAVIQGYLHIAGAGVAAITASDFPYLTRVTGELVVTNFAAQQSTPALNTLTLAKLQTVGGMFQIAATTGLTTASFPELTSVGSINSVTGSVVNWNMPKLTTINGTVDINFQSNLCTFNAPRVSTVTGTINLGLMPKVPASSFTPLVNARRSTLTETNVGCCFLVDNAGCEDSSPADWQPCGC